MTNMASEDFWASRNLLILRSIGEFDSFMSIKWNKHG